MDKILKCSNLSKNYGNVEALKNCNIELKRGRIVGLLGPNGSGKTTLIKLINGLLVPTNGELLVDGKKIGVETKKVISYLPERTYLDPNVKVYEMFEYFKDFYVDFDINRARTLLHELGMKEDSRIKDLSKGMKEKVQLILVMSRNADLYILDEPIAGVDPASRDYILDTILNNLNKDATLIISTHLIYEIERILDDVIIIRDGNILYQGETKALLEEHGSLDEWFRKEFRYVKTI
ncbi:ABC transporter ATP-binding protein [Haploplasma axanthum]|uniref:ABC transporter ATP-binding protein n=1 Tax=Haploplasma axanthum TaxID=29552 RepID=A0A449BF46_HAPAX|nr:ABC transporter ATP-binding protein [Haploplasma axanthum]VEU81073.1 ABC transporter ATP-binding protein [Haploplasma axanthum]